MKRLIITSLTVFIAIFGFNAMAKDNKDNKDCDTKREQLAEKQAKYIASKLELDDEKTALFITTFSECQKEIWALGPKHDKKCDRKKSENDEEATQKAQARFDRSRQILDIREKYYNEYSKFLTPLQIEEVYKLEKQAVNHMCKHKKDGKKDGKKDNRKDGKKNNDRQKRK